MQGRQAYRPRIKPETLGTKFLKLLGGGGGRVGGGVRGGGGSTPAAEKERFLTNSWIKVTKDYILESMLTRALF